MTPMDTQVPGSVPSTQLRMWSHALLAADSALLMPRICTPHASRYSALDADNSKAQDKGSATKVRTHACRACRAQSPMLPKM